MTNLQPEQQITNLLKLAAYLDCMKSADQVYVMFDGKTTVMAFAKDDGILSGCAFRASGNPYSLNKDQEKSYEIGSPVGAAQLYAMEAAAITKFDYGKIDGNGDFQPHYTASKLNPISAIDFLNIFTTLPIDESYHRFVALFDDDTTVKGTKYADIIETGAGNDKVNARGGNDIVHKWDSGDLKYSGGDGFDAISFGTSFGSYFVNPKVQQLVIDLKTGTGDNPYGGKLKVDSVEKVIGTDEADRIFGDNKRNWIETQDYGADIVKARGGNDTVVLWPFAFGAVLDGGKGKDTLKTAFEYLDNTLDLTDPSNNTGKFENGSIRNFEVFKFSSTSFDPTTILRFKAGDGSETVTVDGRRSAILDLGDGNNKVRGGLGNDTIVTGKGKDRIEGGGGDDFMTGGGGTDRFVFKNFHGHDVIRDFAVAGTKHDIVDLSGVAGIDSWNDLRKNHLTSVDGNAAIETSDDDLIILTGVAMNKLKADHFDFG